MRAHRGVAQAGAGRGLPGAVDRRAGRSRSCSQSRPSATPDLEVGARHLACTGAASRSRASATMSSAARAAARRAMRRASFSGTPPAACSAQRGSCCSRAAPPMTESMLSVELLDAGAKLAHRVLDVQLAAAIAQQPVGDVPQQPAVSVDHAVLHARPARGCRALRSAPTARACRRSRARRCRRARSPAGSAPVSSCARVTNTGPMRLTRLLVVAVAMISRRSRWRGISRG